MNIFTAKTHNQKYTFFGMQKKCGNINKNSKETKLSLIPTGKNLNQ